MGHDTLPDYKYRPPAAPDVQAIIRRCSSRRARLFAGGTYFRSKDVGGQSNNFTGQVITDEKNDTYLIITNRNLKYTENVIGNVDVSILNLDGANWNDLWVIDQLNTLTPRIANYSISCSIALALRFGLPYTLPAPNSTDSFTLGKLYASGKLTVKADKTAVGFTSSDRVFIAPRYRIYKLSPLDIPAATDPVTGTQTPEYKGWDIADMRTQVNADNQWIEMLPRSGPTTPAGGGTPVPNPNPADVQDTGTDDPVAATFAEAAFTGGDGLPDNPTIEHTGPFRSLVYVLYGEQQNGALAEINTIYEWVGDDAQNGAWKTYQ